jgi:hypothetical protein
MVICLTISALPEAVELEEAAEAPAFFSKIFQNFRDSSAAGGSLS